MRGMVVVVAVAAFAAGLPMKAVPLFAQCCGDCGADGAAPCSCTAAFVYWSSTTSRSFPANAWVVDFDSGLLGFFMKGFEASARALRVGQ